MGAVDVVESAQGGVEGIGWFFAVGKVEVEGVNGAEDERSTNYEVRIANFEVRRTMWRVR